MSKIFLFSGTTEGREMSEFLSENQIFHTVFVATDYGKIVMKESKFADIRQGRLTAADMAELFSKEQPEMVLDATHPYAVEVSKNIKEALGEKGRYVRISRDLAESDDLLAQAKAKTKVTVVASTDEAVEYLKNTDGKVMLTTGVKTLKDYAAVDELKQRLTARILPSEESLSLALQAGLEPRQIVAMEGPFSTVLNEAMIDQYKADILVTKNSGARGGFPEKVEACANKKTELLVIEPEGGAASLDGMTVLQAKALFTKQQQLLSVVGIGVGNDKSMTVEAQKRIREADLLIGAQRMLDAAGRINPKAETVKEYEKNAVLKSVSEYGYEKNVYLVSGDTGFFSGASAFKEIEESNHANIQVEILPGISSISYLSAALGMPYTNARLVSSHGRDLDYSGLLAQHESFFAITSGKDDFNEIAQSAIAAWKKEGCLVPVTICKGFNLGMADQNTMQMKPEDFEPAEKEGLYVLGVIYGK